MSDIVCVDIGSMYELEDGIRRFEHSLEHCERDIAGMTEALASSFRGCSRYEHVLDAVAAARRKLAKLEAELCAVADDIAQRAEFVEEFERTPFEY